MRWPPARGHVRDVEGKPTVALTCRSCGVDVSLIVDAVAAARAEVVAFFQAHQDCRTHIDLSGAGSSVGDLLRAD